MDDLGLVQVDERPHNLLEVILHLHFRKSFPPLYEFVQSLVGADFQQNVNIFVVLEDVFEFYDVLMGEGFVDFNLSDELRRAKSTFCLARERLSELLAIIFAA